MSQAFQITEEDVWAVLNRMSIPCGLDSPEVQAAFEKVSGEDEDARIEKEALRGDDLDDQTGYALDEIETILKERIYA